MSLQDAQIRAAALSEALPFIQKFRGQTFVIKYGGSAMESEEAVERLLRDVVFLEAVGINPVLVHGGGKAISAKMREAGITARFVNGLRVTDEASIRIVEDVLDREVNPLLVKAVGEFGAHAQGELGVGQAQVGIEQHELAAHLGQRDREIGGHRGLAHATFPAGHADDFHRPRAEGIRHGWLPCGCGHCGLPDAAVPWW
jgi:hypothetical protein